MPIKKKAVTESTSKTVKSMNRLKEEAFKSSGDMNRIIPLSEGEWMYLNDPRDGKLHHLHIGTEKCNAVMRELLESEEFRFMIMNELEALGWTEKFDNLLQSEISWS